MLEKFEIHLRSFHKITLFSCNILKFQKSLLRKEKHNRHNSHIAFAAVFLRSPSARTFAEFRAPSISKRANLLSTYFALIHALRTGLKINLLLDNRNRLFRK